jgi:hypothetical protein
MTTMVQAGLAGERGSRRSLASRVLATEADWSATVARVARGLVMFPHGAQKLLAGSADTAGRARWASSLPRSDCPRRSPHW